MKAGHFKVAEAYILYRALRSDQRSDTQVSALSSQVSGESA